MLPLSNEKTFHFELLRILGMARGNGSDIAEVLTVAGKLISGDFESWYKEFNALAMHVYNEAKDVKNPVSVRNAFFRAANYYRSADFFLHGDAADVRINETWINQKECFDKAIALMNIPGKRIEIQANGFTIPAILYRSNADNKPRPTLLLCNGYDGSQEEMLHVFGFGALERGYNVITFEGPGQPTVVREQHLGFITEWEKVVTPVVDYCEKLNFIDNKKLILLGYSFGGFLVARAAAFEHRLAGVIGVDGLFNICDAFLKALPQSLRELFNSGNKTALDKVVLDAMKDKNNIQLRWGVEQGCWAFCTDSPYDFLSSTRDMSMEKIAGKINCPVLVCEAEADHFFAGQPVQLVNALGSKATYLKMTDEDSAHEHCHVGATDFATSKLMHWIEEIVL
jgi:alpha-beta hydrolase superfamily lysophospholipase